MLRDRETMGGLVANGWAFGDRIDNVWYMARQVYKGGIDREILKISTLKSERKRVPDKKDFNLDFTVKLGGTFEEVGGDYEAIGGGDQKVGSSN